MSAPRDERPPAAPVYPRTLSGDPSLVLPEFDEPPADPLALLATWIESAWERNVREPLALALATADAEGRASSRIVIVKHVDARGVLFVTSADSRKGRELAAVPWAAGTLYWRETGQQVNLAGPAAPVETAESDALFAERTRAARAAAIASTQSASLTDEAALHNRAAELERSDDPLVRPSGWGGYRLVPHEVEFWHGHPARLHRRLLYRRRPDGWTAERLQP